MEIAFITTEDPLYLPAFFESVLSRCNDIVQGVFIAPPLYKDETAWAAARKYARTFGPANFVRLGLRVAGRRIQGRSIAAVCAKRNVSCLPVKDVNAPAFLDHLARQRPDVIVSVSCPQLFKSQLIALPSRGLINLHGALLPQYRGVMPSFWMMANGEKTAGVSAYFVNQKIDAGDLCAQRSFEIEADESLDQFIRRSKEVAADLLLDVLGQIRRGKAERRPLNLAEGSYYSWPDAAAVKRFHAQGRRLW